MLKNVKGKDMLKSFVLKKKAGALAGDRWGFGGGAPTLRRF